MRFWGRLDAPRGAAGLEVGFDVGLELDRGAAGAALLPDERDDDAVDRAPGRAPEEDVRVAMVLKVARRHPHVRERRCVSLREGLQRAATRRHARATRRGSISAVPSVRIVGGVVM